jgi:phosphotransferase system enzyme I (PtsI)
MKGTGVSPGISIGKAFIVKNSTAARSAVILESDEAKKDEIGKFEKAVYESINELDTIKANIDADLKPTDIDIIETQIEFLGDPQIKSDVLDKINYENKTANDSVIDVIVAAVLMLKNINDEYLSARAADVQDIGNRLLRHLNNNFLPDDKHFGENTILIADDIAPSDTITLDISRIAGFATRSGGKTSHAAIIARAKGIPAVVACGDGLNIIENDDVVILDGSTGDVIVRPDSGTIDLYKGRQKLISGELLLLKSIKDLPATTTDGQNIKIYANISKAEDIEEAFENGGEGVGLLRTELLFMGRNSFPTEDEQFNFYKQAVISSKNKPVIIRTLDIGGDKKLPYFEIPIENNPFLGYRAIRICLNQKEIFSTQIRALFRASAFGKLKIMFPMICNIQEVREAKEFVQQIKNDLMLAGIKFDNQVELGIMIEIPSAALLADILADEVDFFSIGTNDLCQYTMAVDRMNEKVSYLYNHFNPGVLRLIQNVIEQAHKKNKHVGMCGEMASDPLATLLLLGMGLDEFSMGAASIPHIKNIIIGNSMAKAREIYSEVMRMDNSDSITAYLKEVSK